MASPTSASVSGFTGASRRVARRELCAAPGADWTARAVDLDFPRRAAMMSLHPGTAGFDRHAPFLDLALHERAEIRGRGTIGRDDLRAEVTQALLDVRIVHG